MPLKHDPVIEAFNKLPNHSRDVLLKFMDENPGYDLISEFGFVPNGAQIYYLNRAYLLSSAKWPLLQDHGRLALIKRFAYFRQGIPGCGCVYLLFIKNEQNDFL